MAEYSPVTLMIGGNEIVWWRPVCHREDAPSREPHGEVIEMLAIKDRGNGQRPRSMTLAEAIALHKHNWNFTSDELPEHEGAHGIKAVLSHIAHGCLPEGPPPLSYQGLYAAEIDVLPIQTALNLIARGDSMAFEAAICPQKFTSTIRAQFERFEDVENLTCTLCHLIALKTGQSAWEIRRENQFSDDKLIHRARELGYGVAVGSGISRNIGLWPEYEADFCGAVRKLRLPLKKDYSRERVWVVYGPDIPSPYTSAFGDELKRHLPSEVPAFACPSEDEILAHHALVKPVLEHIWSIARGCKQGFRLRDSLRKRTARTPAFFEQITMRDVYKAAPLRKDMTDY